MIDLPEIKQEAIDAAFRVLAAMDVELDENPLDHGPRRLNQKVSEVRKMLSDTETLYLKVSSWIQKYKAAHRSALTLLELDKKDLLANDPETRVGRNVQTQDAIASMKLRDQVKEVARMSAVIEDLESMMTVIKSKRSDLKDIQNRIKDQINLCREEIGLGSKWGSRPSPERDPLDLDKTPDVDRVTLRELHEMFVGVRVSGEDLNEVLSPRLLHTAASTSEDEEELESEEATPQPKSGKPTREERATPWGECPQVGFCSVCSGPQRETPSGPVCENGHGGALTLSREELVSQPTPTPPGNALSELVGTGIADSEADDFLTSLHTEEVTPKKKTNLDKLFEDFDL